MNKHLRTLSAALAMVFVLSAAVGCKNKDGETGIASESAPSFAASTFEEAAATPYGRYPELVTYTLGKMSADHNSNMPQGDTYEDNAYTRYLRNMLNIQNENVFEVDDESYDNNIQMAIADQEIPDVMIVQDQSVLQLLARNDMIEDLTQAYKDCATSRIKAMYSSYGGRVLDSATINGKLMALPGTNIQNGPNLLWLRKDWMDALNLDKPTNLAEAEDIVRAFIREDPGGNGTGKTVGLVCDTSLTGDPDRCFQLDVIFSAFGAYPKKWLQDEEGNVYAGSTAPEAKLALEHLHALYQEKVLDSQFPVRTSSNIRELIVNGQCGSFFGPWWAANDPLMDAYQQNPQAQWQPYLIPTSEDGTLTTYTHDATNKYIVVRKGYEHPEIIVKMISVLFDYTRYVDRDAQEINDYFQLNVDPTARPLAVNVDYQDALFRTTKSIHQALDGDLAEDELLNIERSYYDACQAFLQNPTSPTAEAWSAYTSRITAVDLLSDAKLQYVENVFNGSTETMSSKGWILEDLESDAYLQIICGGKPVDSFDTFVEEWNQRGGEVITREVAQAIS